MKFVLATIISLFVAAPVAAQDLGTPPPVGGEIETIEEEGGLSGSVTDESAWEDLSIAIPGFATDRDQPTPASSGGTSALGKELARVITADLKNNGLFRPTGPDALPQPSYGQITGPALAQHGPAEAQKCWFTAM